MVFKTRKERLDVRYRKKFCIFPYKDGNDVYWLEAIYIRQIRSSGGIWYDSYITDKDDYLEYKKQCKWKRVKE